MRTEVIQVPDPANLNALVTVTGMDRNEARSVLDAVQPGRSVTFDVSQPPAGGARYTATVEWLSVHQAHVVLGQLVAHCEAVAKGVATPETVDVAEGDWVVAQWCYGDVGNLYVGRFVKHLHEGTSVIQILNGQEAPVERGSIRRIANLNLDRLLPVDDRADEIAASEASDDGYGWAHRNTDDRGH